MSGKELKNILKKLGITQIEAAKMLNISRSTVQKLLEKEEINKKMIEKINHFIIKDEVNFASNGQQILINSSNNNKITAENCGCGSEKISVLQAQLSEQERAIAEKEARIKEYERQLREKDTQINKLLEILNKEK